LSRWDWDKDQWSYNPTVNVRTETGFKKPNISWDWNILGLVTTIKYESKGTFKWTWCLLKYPNNNIVTANHLRFYSSFTSRDL
jgi:hypothetical protein